MRRRPAEIAEAGVAGLVWAALIVGLSVTALTAPAYTSMAIGALDIASTAGLTDVETQQLSARVRGFVADQDPGSLPVSWRGEPGFDSRAVTHLDDVRRVLMAARVATGVAAGALAAFLGVCVARRRRRPLADSMRVGAWTVSVLLVGAAAIGLGDFEALFTRFHSLFFAPGTWTFAYDSLLIRLFPARFWVTAAVSWALLAGLGAAALATAARYVEGAGGEEGSIRTGEDV